MRLLRAAFILAAPARADFKITVYPDGASGPGGCDAHVVFKPKYNGTRAAFNPASSRTNPRKSFN